MKVEPPPAEDEKRPEDAVEDTLKALLLGELKVRVDPLTGQILESRPAADGEDGETRS